MDIQLRNGTSGDNGTYLRRRTNRLFRDTNAWYHFVLRVDSTQASASDRLRVYFNGVEETSWEDSTGTMPQDYVTDLNNSGADHRLGRGGGYYDKSLHKYNNTIKIGFAYSIQKIKMVPTETHDISMDVIITEKAIYNK